MSNQTSAHDRLILEQFTHQAEPFALAPSHSTEESLRALLDTAEVQTDDEALDVACGTGIVACSLATVVRSVVGVDMVPAMLEQAKQLQEKKQLRNVGWQIGDAAKLAFSDAAFSLVTTRYSLHHLLAPETALREMKRVCREGGRVVVADVTPEASKSSAFDSLEQLRDPSHTHALPLEDLLELGEQAGLTLRKTNFYRLDVNVDDLLAASFPPAGNAERFRDTVRRDIGYDRLSLGAYETSGQLRFGFPVSVVCWEVSH